VIVVGSGFLVSQAVGVMNRYAALPVSVLLLLPPLTLLHAGYKPIAHHWNWFAILLTGLYIGSMGFYFTVRIMFSMIDGPSFW
jgi:hypothetical protein